MRETDSRQQTADSPEPARVETQRLEPARVLAELSALALHPNKRSGASVRIEGGPYVALYWGREGVEVLIEFAAGRSVRKRADVFSTGRSHWEKDRTQRLTPEFAERLASAIAANPEGLSKEEMEARRG